MHETEVGPFVARLRSLMMRLEKLPFPTIAAIDGLAVGGGLEMALACDLRVLAHDVKLGLVETKLAIIPGAGGTQRLPRVVGNAKAKELIYTGRLVDAGEAMRINLVNEVVQQNETKDAAFNRAMKVAELIGKNGPIAVRMAKKAIDEGTSCGIEQAMKVEESCYAGVVPTKDRLEGLSAFQEKRSPVFKGH
jgi:methylglutaconyl-CoA hydratase